MTSILVREAVFGKLFKPPPIGEKKQGPLGEVVVLPSKERVLLSGGLDNLPDLSCLTDAEILDLEREIGSLNLYYMAKYICGFKDLTEMHRRTLCSFPSRMTKQRCLCLMPRGSFKSSILTCAYPLQRIVQDRRVRILLMGETDKKIRHYLGLIKDIMQNNEKFRQLYGDFVPDKEKGWREDEITVRGRYCHAKEPTITCTGVAKPVTGLHYDLIILDDPHSERNTGTIEQIHKVIDVYKLLSPILEPWGKMIVVGTRWHYADLYGHIIDKESHLFDVFVEKAICDDGALLFPERLTTEHLSNERYFLGGSFFSCQYQNEIRDEESAEFQRDWIKKYRRPEENMPTVPVELPKQLSTFTTIDPAISVEKHGDFSAIVTVGVDQHDNWYVLEARRLKVTPYQLLEAIFQNYRKWRPSLIGIESVAFQKSLVFMLRRLMEERREFLPIRELKTDTSVGKMMRIRALKPRFENGKVYIHSEHVELEDELLAFPRAKHDDLMDALAYQEQIVFAPGTCKVVVAGKHVRRRQRDTDARLPVAR